MRLKSPLSVILSLTLIISCCASTQADEIASAKPNSQDSTWVSLFNGKDFSNFEQKGGKATYEIVDDMIVGTAVADTPNSFLCTKKEYGDFILEIELKADAGLNSGIQIRSHAYDKETESAGKKIPAGRVHGYQVEIDQQKDRRYSGGVYDEARRGWLNDLSGEKNKAAREAYKFEDWNQYRIQAIGNSIKTWVNGVPAADFTDDVDAAGFIGLQVHSVGPENVGKQVRWRNLRIQEVSK